MRCVSTFNAGRERADNPMPLRVPILSSSLGHYLPGVRGMRPEDAEESSRNEPTNHNYYYYFKSSFTILLCGGPYGREIHAYSYLSK